MLTAIDFRTVCSEIGIENLIEDIPSMLLAEYFRAAATLLYSDEPLSTQRLMATIESRLRPFGYNRNRFADECFGSEGSATPRPLSMLNTLGQIGDLVRIGNGGHYPAETRFVRIDDSLSFIASALPTTTLKSRINATEFLPAIGRLVLSPPQSLPEQSLESWLRTPTVDYASYAIERMRSKGEPFNTIANDWQVYDATRKAKCWVDVRQLLSDGSHLCRFRPEGVANFQYGVAHLKFAEHVVTCTRFTQLTFADHVRVKYGLHALSRVFRVWLCRIREPWFELTVSNYEGAEVFQCLHAMSVETQSYIENRTRFWISTRLRPSLSAFLVKFGINLVSIR